MQKHRIIDCTGYNEINIDAVRYNEYRLCYLQTYLMYTNSKVRSETVASTSLDPV
jgi:hypothetical protein